MDLQYDGTDFHGWQIQPNAPSIQATIELALTQLNGNRKIEVVGCGRTDTGVHAHHYVAHFDIEYSDLDSLKFKLNSMLPESLKINKIDLANNEFHARFDATKRTYRYFINKEKNPFQNRFAYHFRQTLNVQQMNDAAQKLVGRHDFESFAKHHSDVNNFICEVYHAEWTETAQQYIFEISANRFLRNMVRAIVGTLIDVGASKISLEQVDKIRKEKSRSAAGTSVPGCGLFLWKVDY
jgi:tRNA pseudouridine38-40 synthase